MQSISGQDLMDAIGRWVTRPLRADPDRTSLPEIDPSLLIVSPHSY
jgi:hypothetical protein